MANVNYFDLLPDELLVEIFRYSFLRVVGNVIGGKVDIMQVCKRWYRILQDDTFWKTLLKALPKRTYLFLEDHEFNYNGAYYDYFTKPYNLFKGNWVAWEMNSDAPHEFRCYGFAPKDQEADLMLIIATRYRLPDPKEDQEDYDKIKKTHFTHRFKTYEPLSINYYPESMPAFSEFDGSCYKPRYLRMIACNTGIKGEEAVGKDIKSSLQFIGDLNLKIPFELEMLKFIMQVITSYSQ